MSLLQWLDLAALIPLGISGGLMALRKGMDFYGAMVLAVVTGTGGGMMSDVLIGRSPIVLYNEWILLIAAGIGFLAYMFGDRLSRWNGLISYLDAVGLGLYSVAGAQRGVMAGTSLVGIVMLGVLTGSGGGMLRDVLSRRIPLVLQSEIYALAAAGGALIYGLIARAWGTSTVLILGVAALVTSVRVAAIYLGLTTRSIKEEVRDIAIT